MISNKEIRKQFRIHLLTVAGIPGKDNRAWENKNFTPGEVPWIRETLMPGDERLVANNELEAVGICQFDYFIPIGGELYEAQDVADAIKTAFKPTTVLGGLVRIERSRVLPGGKGISSFQTESSTSPWYGIPILIDYTAFGKLNP